MSYRIKTVAALTGISPTTLRAWERRYDLVGPQRSRSGYRLYDEEDVATLTRVKALVDQGLKAGEAIELVRRGLRAPAAGSLDAPALHRLRAQLLNSLLRLDRSTAAHLARHLGTTGADVRLDEIFFPLLGQVGEMWAHGDCSVAQEHFTSAFVREQLVRMLDSVSPPAGAAPEVVCVGVPGELHEFGLLGAAIHLAMRGWRITYLGADLPIDELGPVLRQRRPALLCSSLICSRSRADCLALAAALRAVAPEETTVVLGGRGLARDLPSQPDSRIYFLRRIAELFDLPLVGAN